MKKIWLAGDSTMQTYDLEKRPFFGWGEKLLEGLGDREVRRYHRENSEFTQECCHEGQNWLIDNCAMAGRSSKTFREEGRLTDIERNISAGDYFIIQFGHNDASIEKPERYVSLGNYEASLFPFINVAKEHDAHVILVSSIPLCVCPELEGTAAQKIGEILPAYAEEMRRIADKYQLDFVDMGAICKDALSTMSDAQRFSLYREDHIHLVENGASLYAKLVGEKLLMLF